MNAWEQVDWIASESLMHLEDALVIANLTARDATAEFNKTPNGYSKGDTVRMRTNPEYQARDFDADGGNIVTQAIRSSKRDLVIEKHYDTSVEVTAKEKALDLESFSEQVIRPAAYVLAEAVDKYLASKILNAAGLYASSALLESRADLAQARKAATLQQLSATGRFVVAGLDLEATLLSADYFTKHDSRGDDGASVFRTGMMGRAMNMDFFSSINYPEDTTHTAGNGAALTNHAAGDNSLIGTTNIPYDGGTGTFEAGDRIQVAGMRRPLIVATQTTGASGNIPLSNPITEVVPDNAAITVIGSGQTYTHKGAIFDDRSIAMAMPVLDPADDKPSSVVANNGVSIRVVQGYDMTSKKSTLSLDLLVGGEAWDPRRITMLADY